MIMGCIKMSVKRVGDGFDIHTSRIGGMTVTCGLVCSVNKTRYLNVEPKAIFLMPGNNFTDSVLVVSNVDWKVSV